VVGEFAAAVVVAGPWRVPLRSGGFKAVGELASVVVLAVLV
jgi:hypothetical protein